MSSSIVDENRESDRINRTTNRNQPARLFYLAVAIIVPPILAVAAIPLRVVQYWGWLGAICGIALAMLLILGTVSFIAFTTVELASGIVILKSLFLRRMIRIEEVEWVELDPPVDNLRMEWSFTERTSQCIIHMKRGRMINMSMMPDGLKRRIAQTLDPANWPPLPEPPQ